MDFKRKEKVKRDEKDPIQLANGFWENVKNLEEKTNGGEFKGGILFVATQEHVGSGGAGSAIELAEIIAQGMSADKDIAETVKMAVQAYEHVVEGSGGKCKKGCDICGGDHDTPDLSDLDEKGKKLLELIKTVKDLREYLEK